MTDQLTQDFAKFLDRTKHEHDPVFIRVDEGGERLGMLGRWCHAAAIHYPFGSNKGYIDLSDGTKAEPGMVIMREWAEGDTYSFTVLSEQEYIDVCAERAMNLAGAVRDGTGDEADEDVTSLINKLLEEVLDRGDEDAPRTIEEMDEAFVAALTRTKADALAYIALQFVREVLRQTASKPDDHDPTPNETMLLAMALATAIMLPSV